MTEKIIVVGRKRKETSWNASLKQNMTNLVEWKTMLYIVVKYQAVGTTTSLLIEISGHAHTVASDGNQAETEKILWEILKR